MGVNLGVRAGVIEGSVVDEAGVGGGVDIAHEAGGALEGDAGQAQGDAHVGVVEGEEVGFLHGVIIRGFVS